MNNGGKTTPKTSLYSSRHPFKQHLRLPVSGICFPVEGYLSQFRRAWMSRALSLVLKRMNGYLCITPILCTYMASFPHLHSISEPQFSAYLSPWSPEDFLKNEV